MNISVVGLMYKDPPVTRTDLIRAQQAVEPVNFPSYKAEISEKAKELALKLAESASQQAKKEPTVSNLE
jgi:hypothetical protein